jgi:hypothetical protein
MTLEKIPAITTTLSIGGHDFNAHDFTSLVGVRPTKIWTQQRDWIKLIDPDINTIEWVYELKMQKHWSIGESIDSILEIIWSKKENVYRFLSDNRLTMHLHCRPFGDASVLEYIIQSDVLNKMAYFGASLSLAVYKDEL